MCLEYFGLFCKWFVVAVNILVCGMSDFGLSVNILAFNASWCAFAVSILVCAMSDLLLLWTFLFELSVIYFCHEHFVVCFCLEYLSSCCEHCGFCCEWFAFAVNILVSGTVNDMLLLSVICFCYEHFALMWCDWFTFALNILVCVVINLLLQWTFWLVVLVISAFSVKILVFNVSDLLLPCRSCYLLWVICFCSEHFGFCCDWLNFAMNILINCAMTHFAFAVNIVVFAVIDFLLQWTFWLNVLSLIYFCREHCFSVVIDLLLQWTFWLMGAASNLLLLWIFCFVHWVICFHCDTFWFVLWVICYCFEYLCLWSE